MPLVLQTKAPPQPLEALREQIQSLETRARAEARPVDLGWQGLPALPAAALHEWFGLMGEGRWTPPHLLLAHVTLQARAAGGGQGWCLWIGRRIWPRPHALLRPGSLLAPLLGRSLMIDATSPADRLFAIDAALRTPGLIVIADGSRLDIASTRRLQLAAEAGGTIALLARPPEDFRTLSVAATRWRVTSEVSSTAHPRFRVELVRCKGLHRNDPHQRTALLERTHAGTLLAVPADVRLRHHSAAAAS